MGKKQHSKDRLFITRTEWDSEWGGYKERQQFKAPLAFYCCALTLKPFEQPLGTNDGYVFEAEFVKFIYFFFFLPFFFFYCI